MLARALEFGVDEPVDPLALAAAFAGGNAAHNAFAVALDAAGDRFTGQWIVGASPELLVRRRGSEVFCRPYAGTAARSTDPEVDRQRAESLRDSAKDLAEHAFVVDFLRVAVHDVLVVGVLRHFVEHLRRVAGGCPHRLRR